MYRRQMTWQKILCFAAIAACGVVFLYALGLMTDLYDSLYYTMTNPNDTHKTMVQGSWIYYDMQPFNKEFTDLALVPILLACLLYITNTHSRRRYYLTNFLAVGAYSAFTIYLCNWAHGKIEAFAVQYMTTINFEQLEEYSEFMGTPYLDNTNMLDLHRTVFGFAIFSVVLLVGNMIWKIVLMHSEKKLLSAGEEAAV